MINSARVLKSKLACHEATLGKEDSCVKVTYRPFTDSEIPSSGIGLDGEYGLLVTSFSYPLIFLPVFSFQTSGRCMWTTVPAENDWQKHGDKESGSKTSG
jgi:hypothetical protein